MARAGLRSEGRGGAGGVLWTMRLTVLPLIIPVVAIRNRLPFVCFDIHLNAEISVYVQPPRKNTTVVVLSFRLATHQYPRYQGKIMTYPAQVACLLSA